MLIKLYIIASAALCASALQLPRLGHRLTPPKKTTNGIVSAPPVPVAVDVDRRAVIGSSRWVSHAPPAFFAQEKLAVKGLRANCDLGEPIDASRPLVKVGGLAVGAWSCTEGGWLSPSPRTSTETFIMLEGEGSVDDADGTRHCFGPGDLVVLPRGWNGRWDVTKDLRKIWMVHSHDEIAGASSGAVVVTPTSGGKVYENSATSTGVWTAPPGQSTEVISSPTEALYILEGVAFVTNTDGSAIRCLKGDTVVLPEGWSGRWDILEVLKAVRVVVRGCASASPVARSSPLRKPVVGGNWKCNPAKASSLTVVSMFAMNMVPLRRRSSLRSLRMFVVELVRPMIHAGTDETRSKTNHDRR